MKWVASSSQNIILPEDKQRNFDRECSPHVSPFSHSILGKMITNSMEHNSQRDVRLDLSALEQ